MFTVLSNENVDGRMIMAEKKQLRYVNLIERSGIQCFGSKDRPFFVKSWSEIRTLISVHLWQVSQSEAVKKRVYFPSIIL